MKIRLTGWIEWSRLLWHPKPIMKVSGALRHHNHSAWSSYGSPSLLKYLHLICIFVLFNGVEILDCALGSVVARWDAFPKKDSWVSFSFSVRSRTASVNLLVAVERISQDLHST